MYIFDQLHRRGGEGDGILGSMLHRKKNGNLSSSGLRRDGERLVALSGLKMEIKNQDQET